jgi:hypothetical protein
MIANVSEACSARKRLPSLANLVRGGALAIMMLGLMPTISEADVIDCLESSCTGSFNSENEVNDYDFGEYVFRLGFDEVLTSFEIHIDALTLSQLDFAARNSVPGFTGYGCVEITFGDGDDCVEFVASGRDDGDFAPLPMQGEDFGDGDGFGINVGIAYDIVGFPGAPPVIDPVDIGQADNFSRFISISNGEGDFRLVHALNANDGIYTENITYQGDNGHCGEFDNTSSAIDQCAAQKDFNFDAPSTVPEPASILLLGPGLLGLVAMRRRRNG